MTSQEQLDAWVAGNPQCPNDRDECCPDFSCCKPELLAAPEVRRAFVAANNDQRMGFLMNFLGAFSEGEKIHIAGRKEN